jgi:hypothetical protein
VEIGGHKVLPIPNAIGRAMIMDTKIVVVEAEGTNQGVRTHVDRRIMATQVRAASQTVENMVMMTGGEVTVAVGNRVANPVMETPVHKAIRADMVAGDRECMVEKVDVVR